MKDTVNIENRELDDLFEKYRTAPDSYVFVVLADACRKMGRLDEALEICEQGVTRHPRYASGFVVKGKCLYDKEDMGRARETFEKVLELDPNNLVALKFLGTIAADDGRYELARRYFGSILELDPDNQSIKKTLRVVAEQEQLEKGDDDLEQAGEGRDPANETVEAADPPAVDLERGIETSDELATLTLADIFASQGYADKARKIYGEILRKNPTNTVVAEKMAALDDPGAKKPQPESARRSPARTSAERHEAPGREPHSGSDEHPGDRTPACEAADRDPDARDSAPEVIELAFETSETRHPSPERTEKRRPIRNPSPKNDPSPHAAPPIGFTEIGSDPLPAPKPPPEHAAVAPAGNDDGDSGEVEDDPRPKIDERETLSHFRRWIRRFND